MNRIRITDLEDPRLDFYRDLRRTNQNRWAEIFIAEGTTLVERLFSSEYEVESVLASDQKLRNFEARIPVGTTVYHLDRSLAAELVGYSFHTGVLAAAHRKPRQNLLEVITPEGPGLVLVADQVIDQQNLGSLIRIASAFGASAVITSPGCADPFSRRVLRVSMGNGLFLPVIESEDMAASLAELKKLGFVSYATVLNEDAGELSSTEFAIRSTIIAGNETHGISEAVLSQCDHQLRISMLNSTDSLNVAISTGIFAHTYRAQHQITVENG